LGYPAQRPVRTIPDRPLDNRAHPIRIASTFGDTARLNVRMANAMTVMAPPTMSAFNVSTSPQKAKPSPAAAGEGRPEDGVRV
jgi:hypothetical protein